MGPNTTNPEREEVDVLDATILAQLRDLDDGALGLVQEMLRLFCEDTPERLEALEAACAQNDGTALAETAHAIKGAAGTMGASRVRALAAALEAAGRSGSPLPGSLSGQLQGLKDAYREAVAALEQYLLEP